MHTIKDKTKKYLKLKFKRFPNLEERRFVRNFDKAYEKLASERGCSPEDVEKWMDDNNYTWHECEDKKTMQKVPNEIHANIPHDGGRSMTD